MKTYKFALAFVAVALMLFAGSALANCGSCSHGKAHKACTSTGDCPGYDQAAVKTFKATVVSIDKETCKGCNMTHIDLVVKAKDETLTVRLGPAWYIEKQDDVLKKDDVIEIFGSHVKKDDHDMFVAGKITKGDNVLVLRDKKGLPVWRGWRHGGA
jgi:hypothetical protein